MQERVDLVETFLDSENTGQLLQVLPIWLVSEKRRIKIRIHLVRNRNSEIKGYKRS